MLIKSASLCIAALAVLVGACTSREPADITLESYAAMPTPDIHAELFCRADGGVKMVFQDDAGRHRFVVCSGGAVSGRYDLNP